MTTCHLPPDLPLIYGCGRCGRSLQPRQVVPGFVLNQPAECRNGKTRQVAGGGR